MKPDTTAKAMTAKIRAQVEDLFEPPQRGSSLEELRDNIWEMYISASIESEHTAKMLGAARKAYNVIFQEVAELRGFGKHGQARRKFLSQLTRRLIDDVKRFKKVDTSTYTPTDEDLAKLESLTLSFDTAFADIARKLTGLTELTFYGAAERERGLARAVGAAVAATATKLRELTLQETTPAVLDGIFEHAGLPALESLSIFETKVTPAHLRDAFAHCPKLSILALRPAGKLPASHAQAIEAGAPTLVELALIDARLGDAPIKALLLERPWPKLKRLDVAGNGVTPAVLQQLAKRLPGVKVSNA